MAIAARFIRRSHLPPKNLKYISIAGLAKEF
jgi:hypothetical protein